MAYVTKGSLLEPSANFLRNFRDTAIENTTAGRDFLLTFNAWYYSWAPSVAFSAATNPMVYKAVQVGVYPLIGILYASYYAYMFVAPAGTEAAVLTAGIVTASLLGLVYVAPVAYLAARIVRRHRRFHIGRHVALASAAWFTGSMLVCSIAYLTGTGQWLMAIATSSMVLSMLSLGSILGAKALAYAQVPLMNVANMTLAFRRLTKNLL